MQVIGSAITWFLRRRIPLIRRVAAEPDRVQREMFQMLMRRGAATTWGKAHDLPKIKNVRQFQEAVPVQSYEELVPYFQRIMLGERDLLWPGYTSMFAKSSGTTNARSKFIPVTEEALHNCHYKAGKDMIALYLENSPGSKVLHGKTFSVGGSISIPADNPKAVIGDVSALIMNHLPAWAQYMRKPDLSIALLSKWEDKIERMAKVGLETNVTSLSGVPTWMVVLIRRMLEISNAKTLHEVWPNLEVFLHGAVAFGPYRELLCSLIGNPNMKYQEIYNASEGFFGIQDDLAYADEMMLMLDYGVFYEFVPLDQIHERHPKAYTLTEVELGKNYAIVITTNAGLWRYMIGDTVRFTSKTPYRIKISGRTKNFINAFGEELIIENAEAAISFACKQTDALVSDFTAAPLFMGATTQGGHEWVIEFAREPSNMEQFNALLDMHLRTVNSDYDAKRYLNIALQAPIVTAVPEGTFYHWLKSKGKLGGQHKVPRLSNERSTLEQIKEAALAAS